MAAVDEDGNRIEVPLIDDYCGSTELGHFLTKDKGSSKYIILIYRLNIF